ncbi:CLUMA_CG004987, isoform A [Clunio marinus]|uniref:CLUMA_CG004987, isoform A n=1 Tax=Clunio marinus TaxID=568069 RepID=A0A1J1HYW8_9DIPT|nr:CLUMA_CG004987, isoform A [Clunio marinus]
MCRFNLQLESSPVAVARTRHEISMKINVMQFVSIIQSTTKNYQLTKRLSKRNGSNGDENLERSSFKFYLNFKCPKCYLD